MDNSGTKDLLQSHPTDPITAFLMASTPGQTTRLHSRLRSQTSLGVGSQQEQPWLGPWDSIRVLWLLLSTAGTWAGGGTGKGQERAREIRVHVGNNCVIFFLEWRGFLLCLPELLMGREKGLKGRQKEQRGKVSCEETQYPVNSCKFCEIQGKGR